MGKVRFTSSRRSSSCSVTLTCRASGSATRLSCRACSPQQVSAQTDWLVTFTDGRSLASNAHQQGIIAVLQLGCSVPVGLLKFPVKNVNCIAANSASMETGTDVALLLYC